MFEYSSLSSDCPGTRSESFGGPLKLRQPRAPARWGAMQKKEVKDITGGVTRSGAGASEAAGEAACVTVTGAMINHWRGQ